MTDAFKIDRSLCLNLEKALDVEWLETNQLGAYSSSTILNCHTRKYHGLLVTPLAGLPDKYVLLSKLDISVLTNQKEFFLDTNKYPGVFHATGHQFIEYFDYGVCPEVVWRIGDVLLKRSIMLVPNKNQLLVKISVLEGEKSLKIRIRPKIAYRNFHHLVRENMDIQVKTFQEGKNGMKVEPYSGMPPMYIHTNSVFEFHPGPTWFTNVEYLEERFRGFPYQEDLFAPGVMDKRLSAKQDFYLSVGLEPKASNPKSGFEKLYEQRKAEFEKNKKGGSLEILKNRSQSFVVYNHKKEPSIIAGYHWFLEWGRDAMISLPGLTIYSGKPELGLEILKTYGKYEKNGLIPNTLSSFADDHGYNSIDAALWYVWAAHVYFREVKDMDGFMQHVFPTVNNIVESIVNGTNGLLKLNEFALLSAGSPDTQLTWMDATANGKPVTPRYGMAVEINALWISALAFVIDLRQGEKSFGLSGWLELLKKAEHNFKEKFWVEDGGYLADVVNENGQDTSVRPNQIFALSVPHSVLSNEEKKSVLQCVNRELVTPFGLRTLSPKDPKFKGEYSGNPDKRDSAYHQGTVWPWLSGAYIEACLKSSQKKKSEAKRLKDLFAPMWEKHIYQHGLLSIAEIFDGNPPHKPRGCIAQAWSVAEAIRGQVLIEKVLV